MSVFDLLKGCPLFYELYAKEIAKIAERCAVLTFHDQKPIIEDGEEGNEIYVILEGEAKVLKKIGDEIKEIAHLHKGDVFGEMVLIDEKMRSADVVSHGTSNILEIPYKEVFVLFKKEPRIFGLLVLNLSRLIATRLRGANQRLVAVLSDKQ